MNREEIMKILPHRDGMLLVDEAYADNGTAHGKYTVKADDWFLQGHFPGNPIVPGVVQCEMLAQVTCVLLGDKFEDDMTTLLTGLNNVKFKNIVRPGDVFETECTVEKERPPFYFAKGRGYVGGKLCVSAEFSFALVRR